MEKRYKEIYCSKNEIRLFFEKQGLIYLERTRIDWKPLLDKKLDQSPYYKTNEAEFKALSRKYGEHIDNCLKAPLHIQKVDDIIGYGVFADEDINKDDFIGEYAGVVQIADKLGDCKEALSGFETDYTWYYLDEIEGGPALEINGRLEGNETRFINHSFDSNVDVEHTLHKGQWVIFFKAAKDIKKDEQLLINYGEKYWEDDCRKVESM